MNRPNIAVVGVGHLGRHHARILAARTDVELIGVADSRLEQARKVAESCGTSAFADFRELIGRVDAVAIAVPPVAHLEVAQPFLEQGIAVLVEKPLAGNLSEGERIVALAEANGALLQVGHIERFNPALKALDQFPIRPRFISAERLSTHTFRSTDIGAVLDLMIHDIDLILSWVASPIRSISAVGVSILGGHEDAANARIEFEDGCVAELTADRVSPYASRKTRIWSEEGYASLDFAAKTGKVVRPSDHLRRGDLGLDRVDLGNPEAIKSHLFGTLLRVDQVAVDGPEQLALELEDFIRAVRFKEAPRVSGRDGLRALRLADRILESLRAHRWEGLSTVDESRSEAEARIEPIAGLAGPKAWRRRLSSKVVDQESERSA
ncbi:MAG: Gfo/Idh/MocA family oxidoreductase [Isosphaeraceae bacterium]